MATLSSIHPTLLDLANRLDPDGKVSAVVEILNETNEVLDDMVWREGNLPTGHQTVVRTGLPTPTWRKMYGGVQPTKSRTAKVTHTTGMLEAYAEVDKALADLDGNTAEFRLSEDRPHIEAMSQKMAETLFYGNEATEPEAFTGFSPHFNDKAAESGDNIIDAGGTGSDNASIWLVVWGMNTVFGIIPKGSKAGIQVTDKGQVTIEDVDGAGGRMEAYRTHYRWDAGLCVRDWRYVVRIANIDKSLLTKEFASGKFVTGADLPDLMFQAMRLVPNLSAGRPAFYASRDIVTWIGRQTAAAVHQATLTSDMVGGKFVERFKGIPVRRVDALAADEARVT